MINLRGHHIFCTALFGGKGYSEAFCKNMGEIIGKFENESIKIISGADDVCQKCLHKRDDGFCMNGMDNVRKRDANAIKVLSLEENTEYSHAEIVQKLKNISEKDFGEVCNYCEWGVMGLCSYDLLNKKLYAIT